MASTEKEKKKNESARARRDVIVAREGWRISLASNRGLISSRWIKNKFRINKYR